jgi:hypothetical protein
MENKRIYTVVAQTVLAPLNETSVKTPNFGGFQIVKPEYMEGTKTIKQPPGREVAQHGHATSMARDAMLKDVLLNYLQKDQENNWGNSKHLIEKRIETGRNWLEHFVNDPFIPYTTIVLSARGSFELYHVRFLLSMAGIKAYAFYDTDQPDYGSPDYKVMTAIATEPIYPENSVGILDYLPLWKPAE